MISQPRNHLLSLSLIKLGSSLNILNPPEPNVITIYNKERGRRLRFPLSLLYVRITLGSGGFKTFSEEPNLFNER